MRQIAAVFLFVMLGAYAFGQQSSPGKQDYEEIIQKKRAIQHFSDYNQDNIDRLSLDGGFLMVRKEAYNAPSKGFRLYKFKADGSVDNAFGNAGAALADLPEACYWANDIAESANGDIYITGLQKPVNKGDFDVKSIVVKYRASGERDRTFGNNQNGYFEVNLNAMWSHQGPLIAMEEGGAIILMNLTLGKSLEFAISLIRIDKEGRDYSYGYFNPSASTGLEYVSDLPGLHQATSLKVLKDGRMLIAGSFEQTDASRKQQGFLAMFDANLKLDDRFGSQGVRLVDADASPTKISTIDDVVQLPDGRLLALGTLRNDKPGPDGQYGFRVFLTRFEQNGNMDAAFGTNGYAFFQEGEYENSGQKLAGLKDGNILVAYHSSDNNLRMFTHKFFVCFDKDGRALEKTKKELGFYQLCVSSNFPYKSVMQQFIHRYSASK